MARGGARQGAGRKPIALLSEETVVIRVPDQYTDRIRRLIQEWDDEKSDF